MILSFAIFDDLVEDFSTHVEIESKDRDEISKIVHDLVFRTELGYDMFGQYLPPHCNTYLNPYSIDEIVNGLMDNDFYVANRFEKYYVIAFAIDYARFEIYSKDCDKKLIQWKKDGCIMDGPIKGIIRGTYNLNPVVELLSSLQGANPGSFVGIPAGIPVGISVGTSGSSN
jgi:hypothetical protein